MYGPGGDAIKGRATIAPYTLRPSQPVRLWWARDPLLRPLVGLTLGTRHDRCERGRVGRIPIPVAR
jgi:hypothetical protein